MIPMDRCVPSHPGRIALLALSLFAPRALAAQAADTMHLEVGSTLVDGRTFRPHRARVQVRLGAPDGPVVAEWVNALTVGDSAGREVHRWVTTGTQTPVNGPQSTWEIRQTYDARTQAPYGYHRTGSAGGHMQLTLIGPRVVGRSRPNANAAYTDIDVLLDRPGFVASASDLVPLATGLRAGAVMVAPFWGPGMTRTERRIFTVVGREPRMVEGTQWEAWRVEERRYDDRVLLATWFLVAGSPYMVAGEVVQPDGRIRYMTEIALP